MDETIKDIRKRCRMAMNGIASASMRNQGLNYKMNFGVSYQKIKEIASRYSTNKDLAETLWLDGTRELKILATLLYPIDDFTESTGNTWVAQIPNQEIREQITVNLLQKLPYADTIGLLWANDNTEDIRTTGYWLLSRRILSKAFEAGIHLETLHFIWEDILSKNVTLRNAANLFLKNAGRISQSFANAILDKIKHLKDSDNTLYKEVYDSLVFEFEFLYK